MNSRKVFQRMRWNFLIAISFALTIAIFAVGVAYAAATVGMNDDPPDAIPQSPLTLGDWGDLPGAYGFIVNSPNGALHLNQTGLLLGIDKDEEDTPRRSDFADGDDTHNRDDEDGVTRDMGDLWRNGETVDLFVEVSGCVGTCYLNGWIDWNGDYDFDDPFDNVFTNVPVDSVPTITNTLQVNVPVSTDDYTEGNPVFAHFRLCSTDLQPPDGCNGLAGSAPDGEVEDYYWDFGPTAVKLVSIEANTNSAVPFALLAGALILLFSGGAILAIKRNRA